MDVITKNNVSARGKQSVLLLIDKNDREKLYLKIVEDILSMVNCAVYSIDSEEKVDVRRFSVSVLIVSEGLIENKKNNYDIYSKLISNQIPIIPIAVKNGIEHRFSNLFGKLQCIPRYDDNNLDKYYKELGKRLRSILVSDENVSEIKAAFHYHVFLSYRRSDAQKVRQVIKFLRQHKKLEEAAIWYDDYLIPGNNYASEIEEEIKNCDIFVLVVTNNITDKSKNMENGKWQDNYVLRVEYPLALKYKKPIIPIMVEDVDKRILFDNFEDIGDVIRCGKKYELQQKIKQISSGVFNKQEDLYSQYLIGMAFLNGVTTEVDVKKGIKIIRRAAENGQKNAITKLAQMYYEGDRIARNQQYAAHYYKKLICEVEKSGSINDYPYCYANYAISIIDDTSGIRNYKESIDILEHGINILRENENTDKEYLFYYALTLANYQKLIFAALYDEALEDFVVWQHKRDEAYNETMSILDKLLLTDEYEEKYRRLKVILEKEKAEKETLPEIQYMYNKVTKEKENNENRERVSKVEELYSNAINDMKILYDMNPFEMEYEYITLLFNASVGLIFDGRRDKASEWVKECFEICEKSSEGQRDDTINRNIELYKNNLALINEYLSIDLLSLIKKYNGYQNNNITHMEHWGRNFLLAIEANYLQNNNTIPGDVYREIGQTIVGLKIKKIPKNEHFIYVLLNLEYAYKGNLEREIINPNAYFRECGYFYASLEQRCYLGNRMINIAKELCHEGRGYDSALNCLDSALGILTEIAKKNKCYVGDMKVAFFMKETLEEMRFVLKKNSKLRLIFIPEEIVSSGDKGVYIVKFD